MGSVTEGGTTVSTHSQEHAPEIADQEVGSTPNAARVRFLVGKVKFVYNRTVECQR